MAIVPSFGPQATIISIYPSGGAYCLTIIDTPVLMGKTLPTGRANCLIISDTPAPVGII